MKKAILLLFCALMAAPQAFAQTGATFTQGEQGTVNKRVSANGKWLVGVNTKSYSWGLDAVQGYESFLTDLGTGRTTWLTSYDEADYAKAGAFEDVSDDGVICGVMKDPAHQITVTEMGYTYTLPLNVAAVWTDGKAASLGLGTWTEADFTNFRDGTFAVAISSDGKTVVGYAGFGNFANVYPCRWTLDGTSGEWKFEQYAVPDGCHEAMVLDVSGDGTKAVGYIRGTGQNTSCTYACYWPSVDECVVIDDPNPVGGMQSDGKAYRISDNGEYIGLTNNGIEPARYIVRSKVLKTFGSYQSVTGCNIGGVTDQGDLVGTYGYSGYGINRPFWYSAMGERFTDFDYYVYLYANDVDIPYEFSFHANENLTFCGVSADGKVIAGNDVYGAPWVLMSNPEFTPIPPSIDSFNANASALGEVTVTFARSQQETYVWFKAKEYVIYRDGNEVGRVAVADLDGAGAKDVAFTDKGVSTGNHYYSVAVNYTNNNTGGELLSPKSDEITVYMEESFEFPLYDDFESVSISTNGWSVKRDYGDINTQFWGCGQYFGLNGSSYLNVGVAQTQPYSFSLVSRHMDARDKENVYVSFARIWQYANRDDWNLTEDSLSVEVSTDGVEWKAAADYALADVAPNRWSFEYIDLTPWAAGKTFQVRLRVHGQALAQYIWNFDNVSVNEKPQHEGTPGAMAAVDVDGAFRLTWKNSIGAYSLNYLGNTLYNVEGRVLGNEGKELIAVNKFDKAYLAPFAGKWLTSVSTQINKYESADNTPIRMAIVVYENGKLVREQEIVDKPYNENITVKLDVPLAIDGAKDLMVGVKTLEYGEDQIPVCYQKTSSYVDGKSNLYSEDGGNTWQSLAEFYSSVGDGTEGFGSWIITANVTDEADVEEKQVDANQFAYEVYKNGRKYSQLLTHYLQGGFTDTESVAGDTYEVRTFFYDGTVSELSNAVRNDGTTGIGDVDAGRSGDGGWTVGDGELNVLSDVAKIELYTAGGVKVYEGTSANVSIGNFGHGMFILRVYTSEGESKSHKVVF